MNLLEIETTMVFVAFPRDSCKLLDLEMISPSLWSTCANSDERFIATVHWHSLNIETWWRESREGGLLSSSRYKRSSLRYIVRAAPPPISGPWSVKLMILIILDPGMCQNHRPGAQSGHHYWWGHHCRIVVDIINYEHGDDHPRPSAHPSSKLPLCSKGLMNLPPAPE